jgi:hypothetical protein
VWCLQRRCQFHGKRRNGQLADWHPSPAVSVAPCGQPCRPAIHFRLEFAAMPGLDSSLVLPGSLIAGDFSQMRALVNDLYALAREIGDSPSIVHRMNNVSGVPAELVAALSDAEQDWTGHRHALRSFLDETARSVEGSLAGYLSVEQDIVRSARPSR